MEIPAAGPDSRRHNRRRFKTRVVLLATGANYPESGSPGEGPFLGSRRELLPVPVMDPYSAGKKIIIVGGETVRSPKP